MSTTIVMPQLGESVAEGIINKWLKQEGDPIEKDEPLVEVVTDKVNAEIPSPVAGVLEKIEQPEGATVVVGAPIAIIGSGAGEQPSGNGQEPEHTAAPQPLAETPVGDMPAQMPAVAQQTAASPVKEQVRADRVRSSPLVRRLAEEHGINLAEVPGTGIGGRVSKQDILSFVEQQAAAGAQPATPSPAPAPRQPAAPRPAGKNEELIPIAPIRKMIADRMVQSRFTIPHAVTVVEVDMSRVVRYREAAKSDFRKREGAPLSFVAFAIKATVDALKQHPLANAEWGGDNIILKKDININVAVDAPEGLTIPVIHHADEMSLAGLAKAVYSLADRARTKKLTVEDMQGGTFTVNNTGALGSVNGVSIINYPQAGILSTAAIVKRPVVVEQDGEDTIAIRSMMNLSLSFDHRLLDGGSASAFLNAIKQTLESWPAEYPLY
ncbi:MAG: dihydrolipoamide acetyltransferase family protein [Chloroflexota bacterium]